MNELKVIKEKPNEPPYVGELTIPVKQTGSTEWHGGWMHLTFSDLSASVTNDDGEEIGSVKACLGGTIEVNFNTEDGGMRDSYSVSFQDIWNAVCKATGRDSFVMDEGKENEN